MDLRRERYEKKVKTGKEYINLIATLTRMSRDQRCQKTKGRNSNAVTAFL